MSVLRADAAEPPLTKRSPTRLETHGVVRVDDYYWLRERERGEVIDYLHAENTYTDAVMAQTEALQDTLFEEIKARIKQTDMSVPYREGDFTYYRRYEDSREYPLHCRRPEPAGPEVGQNRTGSFRNS